MKGNKGFEHCSCSPSGGIVLSENDLLDFTSHQKTCKKFVAIDWL